jgi:phosphoribosylanthranilate isomerase|tara:strand:+ start:86 stop:724 length:639 start_codon:yes stop_codon:yes gene_type:complete
MIQVKICGVKSTEEALAATNFGANFIGFNFVPGVRRKIEESTAFQLIREYRNCNRLDTTKLVGVFANQPIDEVNRILENCDLDMAQLSGYEPMEYTLKVNRPVIKSIHVQKGQSAEELHKILTELELKDILPLLEPQVFGAFGGTGTRLNLKIAKTLSAKHRFLLAGGLKPSNVTSIVKAVFPWGVDVSSGVETNGIKDREKIRSFIKKARV